MENHESPGEGSFMKALRVVEKEYFWGDYKLTAAEIVARLQSGDQSFKVWLFSKIVDNSSHPSHYLRVLFSPEEIRRLHERASVGARGRRAARLALIAHNLLGAGATVAEYAWRR
jgi:hypothetical protein